MSYVAKILPASMVAGLLTLAAGILPAYAQVNIATGLDDLGTGAGLSDASLPEIVGGFISVFLGLLGIIFLVLVLYAGFLWMTAAGETDKTDKAKKLLTQAIIGLVLIVGAYAISGFVVDAIGTAGL